MTEIECQHCNGSGTFICSCCNRIGSHGDCDSICYDCSGEGIIECIKCNGKGKVEK